MDINDVKLGTRLELEVLDDFGERINNIYVSQVLEPVVNGNVVISTPIFENRLIYIPLDHRVRITFLHSKYGLCGFTGIVAARVQKGNLWTVTIRADSKLEQIQRRTYFRFDCILNVEYALCSENTKSELFDMLKYKKGITKNISGSGACLIVTEEITLHTYLAVRIKLNGSLSISARCQVIRIKPMNMGKAPKYELGVHFTDISGVHQDNIIRFIFEQQRLLLKKDIQ